MKINLVPEKINLLYIEDDVSSINLILEFLKQVRYIEYKTVTKTSLKDGLKYLNSHSNIDAILLDLTLPNSKGINTFLKVKEQTHNIPIIIISGYEEIAIECVKYGAQDYLVKPDISSGLLCRSIKYAIERVKLENTYKNIIRTSTLGYHMYKMENDQLIFTDYNPAAEQILKVDNKQFIGLTLEKAFPGFPKYVGDAYVKAMNGEPFVNQIVLYKDNSYFKINAFKIADNQLTVTFEDITEQQQFREILEKNEKKYRNLVEVTGAGIYSIDFLTQKFIYVNHIACLYTGYTEKEFKQLTPADILAPHSLDLWLSRLARITAGEFITSSVEYEIIHKDSSSKWALITAEYIEDDKGNIIKSNVVGIDITQQKLMEFELKAKEIAVYSQLEQKIHSWKEEMTAKENERQEQLSLIDSEILSLKRVEGNNER